MDGDYFLIGSSCKQQPGWVESSKLEEISKRLKHIIGRLVGEPQSCLNGLAKNLVEHKCHRGIYDWDYELTVTAPNKSQGPLLNFELIKPGFSDLDMHVYLQVNDLTNEKLSESYNLEAVGHPGPKGFMTFTLFVKNVELKLGHKYELSLFVDKPLDESGNGNVGSGLPGDDIPPSPSRAQQRVFHACA